MNLTKNQIYIIASIVIIAVVYFMFFRKKKAAVQKAITPPSTESGWVGENWAKGPQAYSKQSAMNSMTGTPYDSQAYAMESGFEGQPKNWLNY